MSSNISTLKRVRQAKKRNLRNKHYKSMIKSAIKNLYKIDNKKDAKILVDKAYSTIDKVASKKIIHSNKAANQKSQVMNFYNNLK